MEKLRQILINNFFNLGKTIGAGLATIGLAGAGVYNNIFVRFNCSFYEKEFLFLYLFFCYGYL